MLTIKINILKKNRKYFAATSNGYKCKLIIDENSKNLQPGEHELLVNDKSVRSKYGTDIIYELASDAAEQKEAGICSLKHNYNIVLNEKCRDLGGRFDSDSGAWIFSDIVSDRVEELDEIYNSEPLKIELKALERIFVHNGPVTICGYIVAKACGRDSGAKLGKNISLLSGKASSGGSHKNYGTVVEENSVIRMKIPENLINDIDKEEWEIKILD